jgi:hypothetical protein
MPALTGVAATLLRLSALTVKVHATPAETQKHAAMVAKVAQLRHAHNIG